MTEYSTAQEKKGLTVKEELLGNRRHVINLVCMCMVWISASFGYYLIGYDLKYIRGDIYVNGTVSSSSELGAYALSGFLLKYIGIRRTLAFSYFVALFGMLSLILSTT